MAQNFNVKNIRTLLTRGFTDEELRRLCYDNPKFRPVYDQLSQGMGKSRVVQELIEYAERQELVETLLAEAKKLNPARYEKHQPYYSLITGPTTSSDIPGKSENATPDPQPTATSEAGDTQGGDVNISNVGGGEVDIHNGVAGTVGGEMAEIPKVKNNRNWGKIGAIAGIVGAIATIVTVIIALIALAISPDFREFMFPSTTPTPISSPSFSYQVRVQAKDTGDNIPNAVVTIEVGGKAPLDGITDSNGLTRIFISPSHKDKPGRLIVEVEGYERHTQNIDLVEGALPDVILLEPEP